jgi:hypothetical protein
VDYLPLPWRQRKPGLVIKFRCDANSKAAQVCSSVLTIGIIFQLLRQTVRGCEFMTSEVRQQDKILRSAECQGQKEVEGKLLAEA